MPINSAVLQPSLAGNDFPPTLSFKTPGERLDNSQTSKITKKNWLPFKAVTRMTLPSLMASCWAITPSPPASWPKIKKVQGDAFRLSAGHLTEISRHWLPKITNNKAAARLDQRSQIKAFKKGSWS